MSGQPAIELAARTEDVREFTRLREENARLTAALEVALEWIDMRCDVAEFPASRALIVKALA